MCLKIDVTDTVENFLGTRQGLNKIVKCTTVVSMVQKWTCEALLYKFRMCCAILNKFSSFGTQNIFLKSMNISGTLLQVLYKFRGC